MKTMANSQSQPAGPLKLRPADALLALVIGIVLLALHLTFFHFKRDFFFPDSITYLQPARSLEHGRPFQTEPGVWETMRTPGYPIVLAALERAGASIESICVVQHVACVAIALGLFFFVLKECGSRLCAAAAALFAGIDPPTIHHANKILSETTATAALLIFFVMWWSALRRPTALRFATAGLLLGINVLVRPVALYFFIPAAIVSAILLLESRMKLVAIFVGASIVLPYAWATRNYVRVGVFTVSSIAGSNLLLHRAAGVLAVEDRSPDEFKDRLADWQDTLTDDVAETIDDEYDGAKPGDLPQAVVGREYAKAAVPIILSHIGAYPHLAARGMFINVFGTDFWPFADVSQLEPETVHLMFQILVVAMALFAAIGIVDLSRRNLPLALLVVVTVFYFVFMAAGGESEARFRVPVVPEYAIAIGAGVASLRERFRIMRS